MISGVFWLPVTAVTEQILHIYTNKKVENVRKNASRVRLKYAVTR